MAERTQALVTRFQSAVAGFIDYVEGLTDAQWQTLVPNEERTVGVVAHHVANAFVGSAQGTFVLSNGRPLVVTGEAVDQGNAKHAEQSASVTKEETVALLRKNSAASASIVARLSDAQLDKGGTVAMFGGEPLSAQQFAERGWIGHLLGHWDNIKAVI